ncbi:hypothetical protein AB0L10_37500 [Streptomyces flaveolus]|uniref:hypothetical protein n=1 Tax=Streptomyces flaveolus TaxID=67297 RepID=UPI0034406C2B
MVDITEIYVHWYAGRSKSELAASLGVDRKTVRKAADERGDWSKLIKQWFPGLVDRRLRQVTWPEIDQHGDCIKSLLGTVTVSTIHQRLRDEQKLHVSISSFRRWVHATLPDEVAKSQVTVLWDEIEPGSETQIDYGFLGQWIDPRTGKRHRVWAFVMVLPCSRHMFVRPVLHLTSTRGPKRTSRPFATSAASRAGLSRTISRPASTSPTSTTRRSTKPMPNSPPIRCVGRSRPGGEAEVRTGVHLDRAHAGRGRHLEPAGRRATGVPAAGRGRSDGRVRGTGGGRTVAFAADLRAEGSPFRPGRRHGRPSPVR